jgi:hypothetical protein
MLYCTFLEIRTYIVLPAKEWCFSDIGRMLLRRFDTETPAFIADYRALYIKMSAIGTTLFHFSLAPYICFADNNAWGKENPLSLPHFPADLLVWKPLLRTPLFLFLEQKGGVGHPFASQPPLYSNISV